MDSLKTPCPFHIHPLEGSNQLQWNTLPSSLKWAPVCLWFTHVREVFILFKQIVFNGEIVHVTKKDRAEKKYNTHTGTMLCFALLNIDFTVGLSAIAVSLQPVCLRLHLHQSRDCPLEGKDLLLGCEEGKSLCCLLNRWIDTRVGNLYTQKRNVYAAGEKD